jgi:hypothetical protein
MTVHKLLSRGSYAKKTAWQFELFDKEISTVKIL